MLLNFYNLSEVDTNYLRGSLEAAVERFLQYAANWPDAKITYRASDMRLYAHSDASHLSEERSRSRAGGFFYLGWDNKPDSHGLTNGSLGGLSTIIATVTASAAESEYAALFSVGQKVVMFQKMLHDIGYPQERTRIQCDNQCAVGIANDTVKQKRSKAIDMRYNWTKDRVQQGQFDIFWAPGTENLADFFTKVHPAIHFLQIRELFTTDSTNVNRLIIEKVLKKMKSKTKVKS